MYFSYGLGIQPDREEKVSLELSEEILQSMEVGMAFRDYVTFSSQFFCITICCWRLLAKLTDLISKVTQYYGHNLTEWKNQFNGFSQIIKLSSNC